MKLLVDKTSNVIIKAHNNIVEDNQRYGYFIEEENTVYPFVAQVEMVETNLPLPDDYADNKYKFRDDQYIINTNYLEPINLEEQVRLQAKQIEALTLAMLQS